MTFIQNEYGRFFKKVDTFNFDKDKCWHWLGASKGNGYGHVTVEGKNIPAHRYSYMLMVSREIPEGMDICHTCDVRYCVNPDHLFIGTRKENMQDMKGKGRGCGNERKHLKEHQVQEIKQRLKSGHSCRKISQQMSVGYHAVTSISRGDSYVWIGE